MKRLFIVGNDTFTVQAMRFALRYSSGVNLFGVIDGQGSVRHAVREAQPDVVVVDGLNDAANGPARVREIREEAPNATILLLSGPLADDALGEVLDAGAMVCLSRGLQLSDTEDAGELHTNGRTALNGAASVVASLAVNGNGNGHANGKNGSLAVLPTVNGNGHARPAGPADSQVCPLTRRELEILRAVAEGHTNARIGRDLWVTEQTVKFHLSNIYRKLGVSNRTEASRYALVNDLFGTANHNGSGGAEHGGSVEITARARTAHAG
jgi:DNA-binding NarL/FixJ family response regulator